MTSLEMKAFEDQINLTLLNDIISFAAQTAGTDAQQKCTLHQRCIFPSQHGDAGLFQKKYGFLYLGELLERYEERFGMTVQDYRAIALALGYTRDIVKDELFVGAQRTDFLQALRRDAGDDLYLTGALYLLCEGQRDGLAYEDRLKDFRYTRTEELVFAMSLFRDAEQNVQHFKPQLTRLLGAGRTIPVLEHTGIFKWIITALSPLRKQLKGKGDVLLRSLTTLPVSFVKEGGKPYECLRENGYTPLEIACANAISVHERWVDGGVRPRSLLAEKIMVALFRVVLEREEPLPAPVYERLTGIYAAYSQFDIKCYEVRKLSDTLDSARVTNPETMAWFIERTSARHPAARSFDILDPKWDTLAASLDLNTFWQLFEGSLTEEMDAEELQRRIGRCGELTRNSYMDRYWEGRGGGRFALLVNAGVIDLWTAFQASIDSTGAVKKEAMLYHIGNYVGSTEKVEIGEYMQGNYNIYAKKPCRIRKCAPIRYL